MSMLKKSAFLVRIAGSITLVLFVLMPLLAGFPAPAQVSPEFGFRSAFVWMEFVRNRREIDLILGPAGESRERIADSLVTQQKIDFAFMTALYLFFASLLIHTNILNLRRNRGIFAKPFLTNTGLAILPLLFLADLAENVQILRALECGIDDCTIPVWLNFSARLKWGCLGVVAMITGLSYASYFGRSAALLLPFVLTTSATFMIFSAVSQETHYMAESGALLLAIGLLAAFLHAYASPAASLQ